MDKEFGKFTADQLRELITWLPAMDTLMSELETTLAANSERFDELAPGGVRWADAYEMPLAEMVAEAAIALRQSSFFVEAAQTEDPEQTVLDALPAKRSEPFDVPDGENQFADIFAWVCAIRKSFECLMLYGRYINDLVAIGKDGGPEGDKALCDAVRIDRSVLTGATAAARLNRALVLGDEGFLADLRNALEGRTGKQAAYLKGFRVVIQALADGGALDLPNQELVQLMLDIGAYADVAGADKNVAELIRKAKKMHAI
jgi:hypothetical protein